VQYVVGLIKYPDGRVEFAKVALDCVLPKGVIFSMMTGILEEGDATAAFAYTQTCGDPKTYVNGTLVLNKHGKSWVLQPLPWPEEDEEYFGLSRGTSIEEYEAELL